MSGSDDLPGLALISCIEYLDDSSEWVELSAHFLGTGNNSPRGKNPGVVMHSTNLSMLCSALEEHIKSATPGVPPSETFKSPDFAAELCAGQFGEWPSRPNMSGPCSLLQSTGANSSGPASSADITPPNSLEGSYVGKIQCTLNDTAISRSWRLRHSSFFQWRFVGWLLHNFPSLFRHFASFLLGATALVALFYISFMIDANCFP
ncbi:unnamed protein product [Hymenolepis diminuta]|uniref:Uncharacterized protein n=1 Tax=Hymenolepis diminuta TaxID=6216 RepID=A0A0R3S836_HYMDI|nr:unnamed protein product [Hymenolepis diminuta]